MQRTLQKALSSSTYHDRLVCRQIFCAPVLCAEAARVGSDLERWKLLISQVCAHTKSRPPCSAVATLSASLSGAAGCPHQPLQQQVLLAAPPELTLSLGSLTMLCGTHAEGILWCRLHPAARAGILPVGEDEDEQSVQEAYTPDGQCFGCGAPSF